MKEKEKLTLEDKTKENILERQKKIVAEQRKIMENKMKNYWTEKK